MLRLSPNPNPQGVTFVTEQLLGTEPGLKLAGYLERVQLLAQQMQAWASKTPKQRPGYAELVDSGRFLPLQEILGRTVPFIAAACQGFGGTSAGALRVRDAVVLSAVAGDG